MTKSRVSFIAFAAALSLMVLAFASTTIADDTKKIKGLIKARDGDTLLLQTQDAKEVTVLLSESTKVGQKQGMFKARRKEMAPAALIPGLAVDVEGAYNNQNQFAAKSVSFKGDDLKRAQAIEAGMHETKTQAQQNQQELEKQGAEQQAQKAQIAAASARFGQLDDYYILDEVTVYFPSGKTNVDPKYKQQLVSLANEAKGINGYLIEVKGFASPSGSTELNQQLSEDRADNVTNILVQQGRVPLTRMLAPGAMGESEQVASNEQVPNEEAANRRVVVRILQNKAVAGVPGL
jgi:outer membrane protein OmpA-like peptidoglycan-associated protein